MDTDVSGKLGCPEFGDWAGYDVNNTREKLVGEPGSVANANCCHCFGTWVSEFLSVINVPTVVMSTC